MKRKELERITKKIAPSFKAWLEFKEIPIIGKGGAKILESIDETRSIAKAAQNLKMSYKYVWNYVKEIERKTGIKIVRTYKGGKLGGGAELTETGKSLLKKYEFFERYFLVAMSDREYMGLSSLKLSARNRLKGKIEELKIEGEIAKVKIRVNVPVIVTAVITKEAAEDLELKEEDSVEAIVKATEVMIAKSLKGS
ncbi:MAG: TOBE domain-containing protein [Candidatus Bathyarchaeia archaeon]